MIDLHIHTTNSDGRKTVVELLKIAEKEKLKSISFCDHNVLGAHYELRNIDVTQYFSGKIFTGIEFDFTYQGKLFHMLGYNFDIEKLNKSKYIDRNTDKDLIRIETETLEYLKLVCKKLGIKLSENLRIISPNDAANDLIKEDMLKYEENNEILDELLGKDRKNSFWRGHITNPESPFYIDFTKGVPGPKEVADEIHKAGGIVVLPHVFEYKNIDCVQFLNDIYNMGILDGVECIHTKFTEEQVKYLEKFCEDKKLIMTGGSDYHIDKKQRIGYGCFGKIEISDKYDNL